MTVIYLDSNIYRQLGTKFKENIDYINLSNLLETSGNEFGLLEVVFAELYDYFENEIFGSLISDHEKLIKKYKTNPYLDSAHITPVNLNLQKVMEKISEDLKERKIYSEIPLVHPKLLLEFLLHNKKLHKKDNTRDYLILYTLIKVCKTNINDHVVLISQDDIFSTNEYFKTLLGRKEITNLKIFSSITDFIKDFGPKLDFINSEFIVHEISKDFIAEEILKDIKCFPSYISKFYHNTNEDEIPDIDNLEICKIDLYDFYVVKDYTNNKLKINISLKIDIIAKFKPELKEKELEQYLKSINNSTFSKYKNTFDEENCPIFDGNILFILEGEINETEKTLSQLVFIDFIPDYFIIEGLKQQNQTITTIDSVFCQHEMDVENGYWKQSKFGGGLSWHYRCKKCMIEYDTGDFYD